MISVAAVSWWDGFAQEAAGPSGWLGDDVALVIETALSRRMRHYARLPSETRLLTTACAMALNAAGLAVPDDRLHPIGVVGAGMRGWLAASVAYFEDYLRGEQRFAKGGLFVQTLPTSALGVASIALGLTGPVSHCRCPAAPLESALRTAALEGDASCEDGLLVAWAEPEAAFCALLVPAGRPALLAVDDLIVAAADWGDPLAAAAGFRLLLSRRPPAAASGS